MAQREVNDSRPLFFEGASRKGDASLFQGTGLLFRKGPQWRSATLMTRVPFFLGEWLGGEGAVEECALGLGPEHVELGLPLPRRGLCGLRGDCGQGLRDPGLSLGNLARSGMGDRGEQVIGRIVVDQRDRLRQLGEAIAGPSGADQDGGTCLKRTVLPLPGLVIFLSLLSREETSDRVGEFERPGIVVDGARCQADRPGRFGRVEDVRGLGGD